MRARPECNRQLGREARRLGRSEYPPGAARFTLRHKALLSHGMDRASETEGERAGGAGKGPWKRERDGEGKAGQPVTYCRLLGAWSRSFDCASIVLGTGPPLAGRLQCALVALLGSVGACSIGAGGSVRRCRRPLRLRLAALQRKGLAEGSSAPDLIDPQVRCVRTYAVGRPWPNVCLHRLSSGDALRTTRRHYYSTRAHEPTVCDVAPLGSGARPHVRTERNAPQLHGRTAADSDSARRRCRCPLALRRLHGAMNFVHPRAAIAHARPRRAAQVALARPAAACAACLCRQCHVCRLARTHHRRALSRPAPPSRRTCGGEPIFSGLDSACMCAQGVPRRAYKLGVCCRNGRLREKIGWRGDRGERRVHTPSCAACQYAH